MSEWNYVKTSIKWEGIIRSCVGNFTSHEDHNLVLAKSNKIKIYLISCQGDLQLRLDVPIYGKIVMLELFRPPGTTQDLLFMSTEKNQRFIWRWDSTVSNIVLISNQQKATIRTLTVNEQTTLTVHEQIEAVDPSCRLILINQGGGLLSMVTLNNIGNPTGKYRISSGDESILDIKFLYGCRRPTLALLYQGNKGVRNVKAREISEDGRKFGDFTWRRAIVKGGGNILISVPPPLCGVLVIGEETIAYCSASNYIKIKIEYTKFLPSAYARINGLRYLLGDCNGLLHLLVITHDYENRVTKLETVSLGETSIASSISYLGNDFAFIGSSYGDSQLIRLKCQADAKGSYLEVVQKYPNLGPIHDFCVVDLEGQGKGRVVTCSGDYKDSSLRVVDYKSEIDELASYDLGNEEILAMWSMRSANDDPHKTILVVSFISETHVLRMNTKGVLEEMKTGDFLLSCETLFCHDAVFDQLVQVTSNTVRLVSSTTLKLRADWNAPENCLIAIVTANATQILLLLATGGGRSLYYLEIGNGVLKQVGRALLEYDVTCLDISPIGDDPDRSQFAAVGTWEDKSVRIFSLPGLEVMTTERLEGGMLSYSVLLCSFQEISYLLCGLGGGHLLSFMLDTSTGELRGRAKVSLGTRLIELYTLSSKNPTKVLAVSNRPTIIYSRNGILLYTSVNLKNVNCVCPFGSAAFPNRLAIAGDGKLTLAIINESRKAQIRCITLGEHARHICHQKQTQTFGICSLKYKQSSEEVDMNFVRLLDDKTYEIIDSYDLDTFENGCSILSCSFSDDKNAYYCIGTGYVNPELTKGGRILILVVEDKKFKLVAEKETDGAVCSLSFNALNEKLLAVINQKIQLYKFSQLVCKQHEEEGAIDDQTWDSAIEIRNDLYLGVKKSNMFTVFKGNIVGRYHLGECVNQFMRANYSCNQIIPCCVIFGTSSATIGIIASLSRNQYAILEKLEITMGNMIGYLDHSSKLKKAQNFVDGDLIESIYHLSMDQIRSIINAMGESEFMELMQVLGNLQFETDWLGFGDKTCLLELNFP